MQSQQCSGNCSRNPTRDHDHTSNAIRNTEPAKRDGNAGSSREKKKWSRLVLGRRMKEESVNWRDEKEHQKVDKENGKREKVIKSSASPVSSAYLHLISTA